VVRQAERLLAILDGVYNLSHQALMGSICTECYRAPVIDS
jgi:hypothetical protein